jgi:hypothetical protein
VWGRSGLVDSPNLTHQPSDEWIDGAFFYYDSSPPTDNLLGLSTSGRGRGSSADLGAVMSVILPSASKGTTVAGGSTSGGKPPRAPGTAGGAAKGTGMGRWPNGAGAGHPSPNAGLYVYLLSIRNIHTSVLYIHSIHVPQPYVRIKILLSSFFSSFFV